MTTTMVAEGVISVENGNGVTGEAVTRYEYERHGSGHV